MAKPLVPNALWAVIKPLLPPEPAKPKGGRPRVDDRAALTGITFVLRLGMTCWRRLRDWQAAGAWTRLHRILLVCRRCGIFRPTLRKWWRSYQADGEAGLVNHCRRLHCLAAQKVFADQEVLILSLRRERRLGVKQLRNGLIRQHDLTLSLDTIHRTLVRQNEQVLKRPRRWRKSERRYNRRSLGTSSKWMSVRSGKASPSPPQSTIAAATRCSASTAAPLAPTPSTFWSGLSRRCRFRSSAFKPITGASSSPMPSSSA